MKADAQKVLPGHTDGLEQAVVVNPFFVHLQGVALFGITDKSKARSEQPHQCNQRKIQKAGVLVGKLTLALYTTQFAGTTGHSTI